ncbi:MAG TPA: hypothetical protein VHE53_01690 [Patescibacteria group bacterium]|nr:hypothetical protein [Patescibacteria group bacterium]
MTHEDETTTSRTRETSKPIMGNLKDARSIIRHATNGIDYHHIQGDTWDKDALLVNNLGPILFAAGQLVGFDFSSTTSQELISKLEQIAKQSGVRLGSKGLFTKAASELHALDRRIPATTDIPRTVFDEAIVIAQTGKTTQDTLGNGRRVNVDRNKMETTKKTKAAERTHYRRVEKTAEDREAIRRSVPDYETRSKPVVIEPRDTSYSTRHPNRSV